MTWNSAQIGKHALVLPLAATIGLGSPAHAVTFSDLYKSGYEQLNRQIFKAIGSLKFCAATEVKPWLVGDVIPAFREGEKAVGIGEADLCSMDRVNSPTTGTMAMPTNAT